MANAFGFKTKTDYSDVTLARQRQTAQTALQLKDAMKNVSSTIIEKRIAKKYDDPYSIEAMKERQVSYAGIDPTRSEQARKFINDAMTQQRLDIEQGYKQRAEQRTIEGTKAAAAKDARDYALNVKKLRINQEKTAVQQELNREKFNARQAQILADRANKKISEAQANERIELQRQTMIRGNKKLLLTLFENISETKTAMGTETAKNKKAALKVLQESPGYKDGTLQVIPDEVLAILEGRVSIEDNTNVNNTNNTNRVINYDDLMSDSTAESATNIMFGKQ